MTKDQKSQIRILYNRIKQAEQQVKFWSIENARYGGLANVVEESSNLLRDLHVNLHLVKHPPPSDVSPFADFDEKNNKISH